MNVKPLISAACFGQDVWVRVVGRGTFECSPELKEHVRKLIEKGYHEYIINLIDCEQMDSTFMGTIAGIAQRLRKEGKGLLKVVNANSYNQEQMENLGLDQLFSIQPLSHGKEQPPSDDCYCCCKKPILSRESEKLARREVLISAHKALVLANQANAKKFQNFFESLH